MAEVAERLPSKHKAELKPLHHQKKPPNPQYSQGLGNYLLIPLFSQSYRKMCWAKREFF
jgi:hypothetical protein